MRTYLSAAQKELMKSQRGEARNRDADYLSRKVNRVRIDGVVGYGNGPMELCVGKVTVRSLVDGELHLNAWPDNRALNMINWRE